jgi:hypothetical protein
MANIKRPPVSYSATLRISGVPQLHQQISEQLGVPPTQEYLKGQSMEDKFPHMRGKVFTQDVWLLASPLNEGESLSHHVEWLGKLLTPHIE